MTNTSTQRVIYAIDGNDCLIEVGEAWEQFAKENGGRVLRNPYSVLGRSLWDFIKGESLKQVYREIIHEVRGVEKCIRFAYRCDSPKLKRFMMMEATGTSQSLQVVFSSEVQSVEAQEFSLPAAAAHRSYLQVKRCSVCNRVQLADLSWEVLTIAVQNFQLLDSDREIRMVWSICPSCGPLRNSH